MVLDYTTVSENDATVGLRQDEMVSAA